ncbi:pentapeptide repeat-containing protein [Streptomyces xanthophaeus]|uniref:pentapeptide repeat-containing protein n=1 Tax=Streptomyces xanthophaeus TaxID=67385 RepID=UPI00343E5F4F
MTTTPPDAPAPGTPDWPRCGHRVAGSAAERGGCRGRSVALHTACLAHLGPADRSAYLAGLRPGGGLDHRGTPFTEELLHELLAALTDPADGRPRMGEARFDGARFDGAARFGDATITGGLGFRAVEVGGDLDLAGAEMGGQALFDGARIGGDADFRGVDFARTTALGPFVCEGRTDLSEAVFGAAVTIEADTPALHCRRTRWTSTAALRLRRAAVDLTDAIVEHPLSVAAHARPFAVPSGRAPAAAPPEAGVRITSLRGADAAHLVLADVDLSGCLLAGTIHLDQLRLEGQYLLAAAPAGLRWRGALPVRGTQRRTLAEEHHWRAARRAGTEGWTPAPEGEQVLAPTALAPVYRQLRKAFEDSKHEPGAADFYYGEMEMRRHADDIPGGERSLLTAYWALSGYGLRASRAFGWLLAAMTATVLAMMLWGLPQEGPKPTSTGTLIGSALTMTTETPDPRETSGPYAARLSTERFEKSLRVVVNSVVFRASGRQLTTAGTYTEMASRITGPILLGLTLLAVRGRVKR